VRSAALLAACALLGADEPRTWRTDPAWHDGQAETCVYEATRTIYGAERRYLATAHTNKEHADPATTVKSESGRGVEVFKHHWSERVPTERYDYDFSTMTYTRADDLSAWKATVATQEDCGASFKEAWLDGRQLAWFESVYFPGGGRREGTLAREVVFFDALPLVLRDYDFDKKPELELQVVPSLKTTNRSLWKAEPRRVRYVGTSEQDLPIGKLRAHQLDLLEPDGTHEASFWFAADGAAPMLRALVRYAGPFGVTYRLKSHERGAYWKR
jgi:hypothetical protein